MQNQITDPRRLLRAPLYAVSDEWEHNGYDDSDFYRAMYDPNTGELRKVETWTTRFACHAPLPYVVPEDWTGGWVPYIPPSKVPESIWQRAEQALAETIYQLIRSAEHRAILQPQDAKRGDVLRLTEAHNSRKTKQVLPAGTQIRVNDCSAFGTFYRNGYNHPNRENRSIVGTVLGHPETLVRVPLSKCRLDREPESDESLRQRANELARNRRFEQCWGRVF